MPPMHHAFRPSAERLEVHVLLSSAATAAFAPSGSPIVETLTTDTTVYKVGQPIHITLTETNTTNATIVFAKGKGLNGFTASQDLKDVWKSSGVNRVAPSYTLQPGKTRTIKVTWNGHANVGSHSRSTPLTGTFELDNTLAHNGVMIAIDPARGKGANAGVTSSVPNMTLTLTS
jgi:hypothetical protein